MSGIEQFLSSPAGMIATLFVGLILVLVIVLAALGRRDKIMSERLDDVEEALMKQMGSNRDQSDVQSQRNREELTHNLRGMSDSVTRVMNEMARTQQAQLDSFSGQLRTMSRIDEERMDGMRQSVEHKLGGYESRMDKIGAILDDKLSQNDRRIEEMRATMERKMDALQKENNQKLEEMRLTVDEKLHATLDKRLGESFQLVSERLEQVYKGLGEMQSLASGVGDLKRVLTNVKTRGIWGEIQLGALLSQILTPGQYEENVAVRPGSAERVEFAVKLPGKEDSEDSTVYLPIDAKFPQADYQRLLDASELGDAAMVEQAARQLESAIKTEAKRIRDKYVCPPYTTDFAVMFLPTEGLYAEVLRRPGLSEALQQEYRITVTGPTTLAALLNSLQMGFKTLAIERRSSEVWALLGAVKTEFGRFADVLARTQKKIRQASESIEDAARKTRTIQRKLKGVQELGERESRRLLGEEGEENPAPREETEQVEYENSDWD